MFNSIEIEIFVYGRKRNGDELLKSGGTGFNIICRQILNNRFCEPDRFVINSRALTAAFNVAHTLKGIAGNLGLTPFYTVVFTMVETLRSKDPEGDYPALYQCVEAEYKRVELLWNELGEI